MAVNLRFTVEDVDTQLLTYTHINVYRASTLGGTYTSIGMVALVAATYHYSYSDTTGDLNKWYKFCYWVAGPTESAKSDPFRVSGVTRLRARQAALAAYGGGLVFAAAAGGDANTIKTDDYRVKASQFRTDRGKGTWLLVTTGTYAGSACLVKSTSPTAGSFDIEVDLGGALTAGDEVEWHWLADPTIWAGAINRGLARYWYVDRVPLPGVALQDEYSLASMPWIIDNGQICDVRYYPSRTAGVDSGQDASWAGAGRWWRPRKDGEIVTLQISPRIDSTILLWLETVRPMPALYTDEAALPNVASEALCAALAYDEVLAYLSRYKSGTSEERSTFKGARKTFAPELHRLLVDNRPKPRRGPPQLPWVPSFPEQFKAR